MTPSLTVGLLPLLNQSCPIRVPFGLAGFFEDLAASWRGWQGEKKWSSLEGDITIVASADQLGHIALKIELRSGPYPGAWSVEANIAVDAGQLEQTAKEVKGFLRL